jgi:hypothetical protein
MFILLTALLALATAQPPNSTLLRIDGVITKDDPMNLHRQGSHENVFILPLRMNHNYVIDMRSKFDTYLIVENTRGDVLGTDDDGGENLNSRLKFRPPADGYYRIIATTYAPGASGEYFLSVVEQ